MDGTHNAHPATATEALEQLGRLSLRELSMETLLQTVAELTTGVMPGNPDTSVTLLVKGRPTTVVSTGQLAVALDETQYERGHGPCLHAARTGELVDEGAAQQAVAAGRMGALELALVLRSTEAMLGWPIGALLGFLAPFALRRGDR